LKSKNKQYRFNLQEIFALSPDKHHQQAGQKVNEILLLVIAYAVFDDTMNCAQSK